MDTNDKKLQELLETLPPDVKGDLILMIQRDPRIAKVLTESQGQEDKIIHAVRAGRVAGSSPNIPEEQQEKSRWKKFVEFFRRMLRLKPKKLQSYYDQLHHVEGVHPDFIPLAHGAYENAMMGMVMSHHEDEHHEHEDEHHQDGHEAGGHRAAVMNERQKLGATVLTR